MQKFTGRLYKYATILSILQKETNGELKKLKNEYDSLRDTDDDYEKSKKEEFTEIEKQYLHVRIGITDLSIILKETFEVRSFTVFSLTISNKKLFMLRYN